MFSSAKEAGNMPILSAMIPLRFLPTWVVRKVAYYPSAPNYGTDLRFVICANSISNK